ncbi:MAG TPA: hypothetical protein PK668_16935 [Myxococcota bacterium]|nr:hypothetical protein [Myxococcota bacterium]HRY94845.1 hypothetical protein [Myxococcota bacterium]HSA23061.1 hypothetical protein [Myxococcota bacterium]
MRNHLAWPAIALLGLAGLLAPRAWAQAGDENEADYEQAEAAEGARDAEAEANFDSIVIPQNNAPAAAAPVGWGRGQGYLKNVDLPPEQAYRAPVGGGLVALPPLARELVELPLRSFESLRAELDKAREKLARLQGPAVVLGAADYRGEAIEGALRLQVSLQITLGRPGAWKTVPLIGDDAVLVRAAVGGQPVPVSRRSGYHVWVTQRTGEVEAELEVLVPARGPRGSIEYDFLVARSPITRFACQFPVAGLEPRITAAVQAESRAEGGGTLVRATLRPTTRIHLVGFKDLGAAAEQAAKVYAETMNLLSVDEGALELFTVVRYTILYAGAKSFDILLPGGMSVVSADGMGAFRFVQEPHPQGTLLRGETEFPIRNNYEISLRLRRELPDQGKAFEAPLPHCQGVERESGWLAIEVPGKLQLEDKGRAEVMALDVRQLPEEMVRSAVSPILRAYRYHSPAARVELLATRLPEIEPESGSIDRVRAFTKITEEGNVITDLRLSLRNRLRHSLKLGLPEGTKVSSALLDGQPFNPSRDEDGKLLLPLKRSRGQDRLQPFTLSVILETSLPAFGWFGLPSLSLPTADLPVSSLVWTLYLPAQNIYSRAWSDIEPQSQVGQADWFQPAGGDEAGARGPSATDRQAFQPRAPADTADAGAMPVRFQIPKDGVTLTYQRYWIDRERPLEIGFGYLRAWLRIPAWLGLAGLGVFGLWLVSLAFSARRRNGLLVLGLGLTVAAFAGADWLGGALAVTLGVLAGLVVVALHRRWLGRLPEGARGWAKQLRESYRLRRRDPAEWTARKVWWRISMAVGLLCFGLLVAEGLLELAWLLFSPYPG